MIQVTLLADCICRRPEGIYGLNGTQTPFMTHEAYYPKGYLHQMIYPFTKSPFDSVAIT
jgi:hypothetical protein